MTPSKNIQAYLQILKNRRAKSTWDKNVEYMSPTMDQLIDAVIESGNTPWTKLQAR